MFIFFKFQATETHMETFCFENVAEFICGKYLVADQKQTT